MITTNILLNTDSYKSSHFLQFPPNTEYVYSYIESRGGKFDKTVFFGLQMFIRDYLAKPITLEDLEEAKEFWAAHGEPFNESGWRYIIEKHKGYLPVAIKAVPEGTVVPTRNVLATIVNTDPQCYWLPSFLETALLRAVWYPTTVATISWHCKQVIKASIERTSDVPEQINFKLHDFGARGVSSHESAAIGGAAHLVNFMGTDTVAGVLAVRRYYNEKMAGFSIPAAEHSTMTSWGRDREVDAYRNMLKQFGGPGKMVAVVSDSYDIYNATSNIWGDVLKEEVLSSGATVVVRPDSGDPLVVPIEIISALGEKFGYTVNSKGYKVLPSAVRVIQGDGITYDSLPVIIKNLEDAGWAIDNLAFGMGGGLLQHVNRDTQKFAMKVSSAMVDGKWIDVYKDPIGDHGKMSKRGQLALIHENCKYETVNLEGWGWADHLKLVYRDGDHLKYWTFSEVRVNSNKEV
jgi:nicotinamide phosphoribosyltransferase